MGSRASALRALIEGRRRPIHRHERHSRLALEGGHGLAGGGRGGLGRAGSAARGEPCGAGARSGRAARRRRGPQRRGAPLRCRGVPPAPPRGRPATRGALSPQGRARPGRLPGHVRVTASCRPPPDANPPRDPALPRRGAGAPRSHEHERGRPPSHHRAPRLRPHPQPLEARLLAGGLERRLGRRGGRGSGPARAGGRRRGLHPHPGLGVWPGGPQAEPGSPPGRDGRPALRLRRPPRPLHDGAGHGRSPGRHLRRDRWAAAARGRLPGGPPAGPVAAAGGPHDPRLLRPPLPPGGGDRGRARGRAPRGARASRGARAPALRDRDVRRCVPGPLGRGRGRVPQARGAGGSGAGLAPSSDPTAVGVSDPGGPARRAGAHGAVHPSSGDDGCASRAERSLARRAGHAHRAGERRRVLRRAGPLAHRHPQRSPGRIGSLSVDGTEDELQARLFGAVAYTPVANATGHPALSLPAGSSEEGLPLGAHFMAPLGREDRLLRVASQLERAHPWPRRAPH
jgi:hypothetical protein